MILFDVLILAESGISVLNDLQVAKQLVYSLQVNLSLSNAFSRLKRQTDQKKESALLNKAMQTIRPVLVMVKGSN